MVNAADNTTNSAPATSSFKLTAEIGRSGVRRFAGWMQEEFDPDLRGQRGMRRFDEMRRNDPDVGAILTAIEMSIQSVDWSVERAGEEKADEEAALFLEQCMNDMSLSWRDFINDVCTMFPFGFELGEVVYKLRDGQKPESTSENDVASSKYDDGRIGWRKIAVRHQESIAQWDFDEHGGLRGCWQALPNTGQRVYLPIQKCLLFTTKRERGNPEGYSILRNAWHSYYIKTNIEEIEVISAERDMTGIPVMKLPVGADANDAAAAESILEKLKWDDQAGIVLPRHGEGEHQQWQFETVTSSGSTRIDTDKVIQRSSIAIARSVLAQFLTLGSGRVGSYSLSKDMRDLFHLAVKGYMDRMEETINRFLVARLFKLNNFGELTDTPKIVHGRMGQRAVDTFMSALEKAMTMGMPITKEDWDFIRQELEMPALPKDFDWEEYEDEHKPVDEPAEPDENDPEEDTNDPENPPMAKKDQRPAPGTQPDDDATVNKGDKKQQRGTRHQQQAKERWFSKDY